MIKKKKESKQNLQQPQANKEIQVVETAYRTLMENRQKKKELWKSY